MQIAFCNALVASQGLESVANKRQARIQGRTSTMKTTKPFEADRFASAALVAANEPTIPEVLRKERAPEAGAPRGWDPYDVWRTRVKTPRESDKPVA